jgi:hypothetical protein
MVSGAVLQSAVEQHEKALPVPKLSTVLVGHVTEFAHPYVVVPAVPVVNAVSVFRFIFINKIKYFMNI